MNRFFRRFRSTQSTPAPQEAKHKGSEQAQVQTTTRASTAHNGQTQPVLNPDANFTLSTDNHTPKALTLSASAPRTAALHTATPIDTTKDAPPNPAPPNDAAPQAQPQAAVPLPPEVKRAAMEQAQAQAQRSSILTAHDAKVLPAEKVEEKVEQHFALTAEVDIPQALTLTTPTPSAATLHTATPIDEPTRAQVLVPATPITVPQQPATQKQEKMEPTSGRALIQLNDVNKAYQTPVGEFIALRDINLAIGRGEFVAVVGKSGSGKSTLINMITGIDRPSSGEIFIDDTPIHNLAEGPMAEWRGRNVGIIFQFFQLLPMLSCIENVMLPMDFCNMFKPGEREARALHLLEQVDMVEHAYKLPSEVSGGQQQRVAIARALANDPPLLVADEPTGNLDSRTADAVFQLFARMVDDGKTILMVTHDDEMAHQVRRTITLTDGQIVDQQYHTQQISDAPAPEDDEETPVAAPAATGV